MLFLDHVLDFLWIFLENSDGGELDIKSLAIKIALNFEHQGTEKLSFSPKERVIPQTQDIKL